MTDKKTDDIIIVHEYWPHESMDVKIKAENLDKYLNEIGKTRARWNEMKKKRAEEKRKNKDKKDKEG